MPTCICCMCLLTLASDVVTMSRSSCTSCRSWRSSNAVFAQFEHDVDVALVGSALIVPSSALSTSAQSNANVGVRLAQATTSNT